MENIFQNTIDAYNGIKFYLERSGRKLDNYYCRSKDRIETIYELLGISWTITGIKDLDNLILKVENNNIEKFNERKEWLVNLGREFINDKKIKTDKYYSYNNRLYKNKYYVLENIIANEDKNNRQAFLPIWFPEDNQFLGVEEVPCSIGYHFLERRGKLDLVYFMRSLDINVWPNDIYLSDVVHKQIAERSNLKIGTKSWCVGSLHMFI